jgi:hypothetical protein
VLGVAGVAVLLGWVVTMWLLARAAYRVWRRIGPRVRWLLGIVLPDSPLVKFATGVMLLLTLTVVVVGALPAILEASSDSANGTGGVEGYAEELSQEGLSSDWGDVIDGDARSGTAACQGERIDGPDRDNDGLPDRWERAGETPAGAQLPGADPRHKDLYVQINNGTDVKALSATETKQLRTIWAQMPVENPDGTTGITIHIDGDSERAGSLGEPAVFRTAESYNRYYTASRLGSRHCVYHQVVYGRLEMDDAVGYGSTPGYASIVEGRQRPDSETTYTPRVGVTTHELLHNVAGRVDGRSHTSSGWLEGGADDEYLSTATARDLNQTGLFGPVG